MGENILLRFRGDENGHFLKLVCLEGPQRRSLTELIASFSSDDGDDNGDVISK